MKEKLTQESLKRILKYNHRTGVFIWQHSTSGHKRGSVAGGIKQDGYRSININRIRYFEHRLAWLYTYGYLPENEIDHKDRVRSNNRIYNLRESSRVCNARNRSLHSNNNSGVTGVCRIVDTNRWVAQISNKGKVIYLGSFAELKDAVLARWEGENKYNYPDCNTTSTAYKYLKEKNLIK